MLLVAVNAAVTHGGIWFHVPVQSESDDDGPVDYSELDPPCHHWDDQVGTVMAGAPGIAPMSAVSTCAACIVRSQGYVQLKTGIPAGPFVPHQPHTPDRA
ncbi:hypothetical protein [Nocardia camponoti]|uniref:Uncharacterized protein n=1 Tax=Nocardia camponoti TaxID=1616106 RepID=A0A917VEH8_9NOCA|nr:hypothetical protein [Nocardia camponoti]GGK69176.1 hypothetical protein GCM10011591_46650 [Nocardia camponoti]